MNPTQSKHESERKAHIGYCYDDKAQMFVVQIHAPDMQTLLHAMATVQVQMIETETQLLKSETTIVKDDPSNDTQH